MSKLPRLWSNDLIKALTAVTILLLGAASVHLARAASPAPTMTWFDLLDRPRPAPTQTIQFGPRPMDTADLWLPDGTGPFPLVIMIHGGCWQKSVADRSLMNYAADAMRRQGLAVWNIEYRGVDEPGGGYPGTFLDVAGAADALRDIAPRFNLRTDKVVAFGHSAGGHLALWLAARQHLSKQSELYRENPLPIAGIVNAGGLADLKASAPITGQACLAAIMGKLTGAPSATRPNVFSDTSPAELLPLGVKQISVNGDSDDIAPPVLGKGYTRRAKKAGDDARFIVVPVTGHVELIAPGTPAFTKELAAIKALLR
jgi:acetyl esterase/lipase